MFAVNKISKGTTYHLTHKGLSYDIEEGDKGARYWINADAGWSQYYSSFDAADRAAQKKIDKLLAGE